ncbi:uncharacterized protein LOC133526191 [Cydia pomonella]|uniref:uncharacterized protein LOC133526191 n=1 Tax=Cydia pomonella TaxID=82600 RepID=UPI002ADE0EE7|nr:uncharacterized protein LOC133526191 [Cydia pomonella]XP_061718682.1 uncharacterized protein LOC133526191 [Cydia pomonella]
MSGPKPGGSRGPAGRRRRSAPSSGGEDSDEESSASGAASRVGSGADADSDYNPGEELGNCRQGSRKKKRKHLNERRKILRDQRAVRAARQEPEHETNEVSQQELDQDHLVEDMIKKHFEEKYKRVRVSKSTSSNEKPRRKSLSSASEVSGTSAAPRDPPDEFVQISITRVFESMENSSKLSAVLTQAARAPRGGGSGGGSGSGGAGAATWAAVLDAFTAGVKAQHTRVDHALCREDESPMQDFRFQGGLGPSADEQALQAALASYEAASSEWTAALAELDACDGTLRHARACVRTAGGDRRLRRAVEELEQCAQEYANALKDIHQ